MDTPVADGPETQVKAKRKQKFVDFTLQPGDAALLPLLPHEQRTLLETEGSYKDRAQQLSLPLGTVRSRLHRARASLQRLRDETIGATLGKAQSSQH